MSTAADSSSALPPMGNEDDLPEDDAVAFAVAAVQQGDGMLQDDEVHHGPENSTNHSHNYSASGYHDCNIPAGRHVMSQSTFGATLSTTNSLQQQPNQQHPHPYHELQQLVPGIRIRPAPPQPVKTRDRRVGKTSRRRHEELIQSAAAAATTTPDEDSMAAAIAAAGVGVPSSKHDEKWDAMFKKLIAYKENNGDTLVPQCYHDDPKLGRWVHYQRVEYWLFQSSGQGKITPERIQRLEDIQFEWDPQREKWNSHYEKLLVFHGEHGHCKVPKNWSKDPELANWVRNQRLENTNRQKKGRKSRMTQERLDKLNELGFIWSNPVTPAPDTTAADRGTSLEQPRKRQKIGRASDAHDAKENGPVVENEAASTLVDASALQ